MISTDGGNPPLTASRDATSDTRDAQRDRLAAELDWSVIRTLAAQRVAELLAHAIAYDQPVGGLSAEDLRRLAARIQRWRSVPLEIERPGSVPRDRGERARTDDSIDR